MEIDTLEHAWECMAQILQGDHTQDIVCDIGMPVMHCGVRYNCRVYLAQGKVLYIRPKMSLADDGNYRCLLPNGISVCLFTISRIALYLCRQTLSCGQLSQHAWPLLMPPVALAPHMQASLDEHA